LRRELDLFHLQEEAPGAGVLASQGLDALAAGRAVPAPASTGTTATTEVKAPQILDRALWEKTGHWENYRENMFTTESENRAYALKPMNCPSMLIFKADCALQPRDLPLRTANSASATATNLPAPCTGLMRVRAFTQDDGHIFCTEDQIKSDECHAPSPTLLQQVYRDFGFSRNPRTKSPPRPANARGQRRNLG
jgi:threonyl-tRNA synthetase